MTFERRALTIAKEVRWEQSQTTFTNLHAKSSGSIETDGAGMLQVLVDTISRSAKNSNWVKLKVGQTSPMTVRVAW